MSDASRMACLSHAGVWPRGFCSFGSRRISDFLGCIAIFGFSQTAVPMCYFPVYPLFIRRLSVVYPLFIRRLSAVYSLFIRRLSAVFPWFIPLFIRSSAAVYPPFIRCLAAVYFPVYPWFIRGLSAV